MKRATLTNQDATATEEELETETNLVIKRAANNNKRLLDGENEVVPL